MSQTAFSASDVEKASPEAVSISSKITTADQKASINTACRALLGAFKGAEMILAQVLRSGRGSRGQARSRLARLIDGTGDDKYMEVVSNSLALDERQCLSEVRRTRLPVFSVQGNHSESAFDNDDEFKANSEVHLGQDDGPVAIRLEVEIQGLYVAMQRMLLWSSEADNAALEGVMETAWDGVIASLNDTLDLPQDLERYILSNLGVTVSSVKVVRLVASSATTRVRTELALLDGPFDLGHCFSVFVKLVVESEGGSTYHLCQEEPIVGQAGSFNRVQVLRDVPCLHIVNEFRTPEESPLWVLDAYCSKGNSDRNIWYNGTPSPAPNDGLAITKRTIERVFLQTMGFTVEEVSHFFASDSEEANLFRPFLISILCHARGDIKSTSAFIRDVRSILEEMPQDPPDVYRAEMTAGFVPRTGAWDQEIDAFALQRAIDMVAIICNVFPAEVKNLIVKGETASQSTVGPKTAMCGFWRDGVHRSTTHPALHFLLGYFALVSSRLVPWVDWTEEQANAWRASTTSLLQDNLASLSV